MAVSLGESAIVSHALRRSSRTLCQRSITSPAFRGMVLIIFSLIFAHRFQSMEPRPESNQSSDWRSSAFLNGVDAKKRTQLTNYSPNKRFDQAAIRTLERGEITGTVLRSRSFEVQTIGNHSKSLETIRNSL